MHNPDAMFLRLNAAEIPSLVQPCSHTFDLPLRGPRIAESDDSRCHRGYWPEIVFDKQGIEIVIDRNAESLVREILNAVIVADGDRFERALKAIPDDQAEYALWLILGIDRTVMSDLHDSQPSDKRFEFLASEFVRMQDWYNPKGLPVEAFLRSLTSDPGDPVSADVIGLLAFLVGGWLLAAFLSPGTHWYQYLDDILERLDVEV